jgi:hypothetical protein
MLTLPSKAFSYSPPFVPNDDAFRDNVRPLLSPPFLMREIAHLWYTLPFLVSNHGQPTLQISELLLDLWSLSPMFC